MVDKERVCCLCGDVGFPQQLFRCSRCRFRFQHSYCSNYYYGNEPKDNICDWCQFESGKNPSSPSSSTRASSKRPSSDSYNHLIRSEYTGSRIKMMHHHDSTSTVDNNPTTTKPPPKYNPGPSPSPSPSPSGVPSPRPNGHRRYKLLKDVMC